MEPKKKIIICGEKIYKKVLIENFVEGDIK